MAKPGEHVNTSVLRIASCQLESVGLARPLNANYANLAIWADFFGCVGRGGCGWQGRMTWLNHRVSKAEILLAFRLGPGVGP